MTEPDFTSTFPAGSDIPADTDDCFRELDSMLSASMIAEIRDCEEAFTLADFSFDSDKQVYICPQGKELTCHAHNQVNRHRIYDVYYARVENCVACPLRERCLSKANTSRRYLSVQVSNQPPSLIDEMKAKIDSEDGKRIYARRLGLLNRCLRTLVFTNT